MPPRKRNPENKGLPARWRHYHGAYFYQVPPGLEHLWDGKKQFRLGKTLHEAHATWSKRIETQSDARTIADLLDRYAIEVVPTKAPRTQAGNIVAIKTLRAVFGPMALESLEAQHVYQYLDKRGARTQARREVEVLSHAFTKAIEWGMVKAHPIKGKVVKRKAPPSRRYVEDWELAAALSVASDMLRAYIGIKLLTGLRRTDMLLLRMADIRADGIHVEPHKTAQTTGKRLIIEWSPALREAVDAAKAARPKDIAPWLFCTRQGKPYMKADGSANAFDSLWQRFMAHVLAETDLTERFAERDLRAKCASDAESLEHAQRLLAHAATATTERIYRRKAVKVKPLR